LSTITSGARGLAPIIAQVPEFEFELEFALELELTCARHVDARVSNQGG